MEMDLSLGVRYYEEGTECGNYIKMFLVDIKHGYTNCHFSWVVVKTVVRLEY